METKKQVIRKVIENIIKKENEISFVYEDKVMGVNKISTFLSLKKDEVNNLLSELNKYSRYNSTIHLKKGLMVIGAITGVNGDNKWEKYKNVKIGVTFYSCLTETPNDIKKYMSENIF